MSISRETAAPLTAGRVIERYFQLSLYLLVVAGFATIAATGKLDFPSLLLVALALVVRGYQIAKEQQFLISERVTSLLTLLYVAFYLADLLVLSRTFVSATVHLVLFALVVKLFSVRRERDHLYLAVLSFMMILAAAVLTVDSIFLAGFALFMLVCVTTFILMEMRRSSAAAFVRARDGQEQATRNLGWWLAATGPVFMLLILLGGSVIFFLMPRVSAGYLGAYAPGGQLSTGFSDSVRLGQIGVIQQSDSVVMHIQIEGDSTGGYNLKWRGISLSLFDGRSWTNPLPRVPVPHTTDGSFVLKPVEDPQLPARPLRPLRYRVLMEPMGANVFFLTGRPVTLAGPYRQLTMDAAGTVFDSDREHAITGYEASSDLAEPSGALLRNVAGQPPATISLRYLQMPRLDPRIRELALGITAVAGNDYDRAVALEKYLSTRYAYTLQLPRVTPHDALANFLFERKQGHCEYFASAMAIMLRELGIPSRIVNGFRGGQFNDLNGTYIVRARDAHSWVEAYFPGQGWISFDPTPAAATPVSNRWDRLLLYLDAASEFWREWVVNYDFSHQRSLQENALRGTHDLWAAWREWGRARYRGMLNSARSLQRAVQHAPEKWTLGIAAGVISVILLLASRRILQAVSARRLASRPERSPHTAASIWYARMTGRVAQRGWRKAATQTPQEFVTTILDPELRASVQRFTRHYERARFAGSAEDAQRLPELYEEVKSAPRS
jgi:transglutaminase-like putative cysteine protease